MVDQPPLDSFGGVPVREYRVLCATPDGPAETVVAAAGEDVARDIALDAIRLELDLPLVEITVTSIEDLGPGTM